MMGKIGLYANIAYVESMSQGMDPCLDAQQAFAQCLNSLQQFLAA